MSYLWDWVACPLVHSWVAGKRQTLGLHDAGSTSPGGWIWITLLWLWCLHPGLAKLASSPWPLFSEVQTLLSSQCPVERAGNFKVE